MRCMVLLVIFACFALGALADGMQTGISWPGWRVETSQITDAPGYPITYMLDGSPASAWVYDQPPEGYPQTPHGVGARIRFTTFGFYGGDTPFRIDGIDLINGYAKDSATYWRNNRIREVRVSIDTGVGDPWEHTFPLDVTREMQRLAMPAMTAYSMTIEVTKVDIGKDDDLCISELALSDRGKRVPWNLTSTVLFNENNDCGCGGLSFKLVGPNGGIIHRGKAKLDNLLGVARMPKSGLTLLSTDDMLYLYDFATGKFLFERQLSRYISQLGWIDRHTALIGVAPKVNESCTKWYRLKVNGGYSLKKTKSPGDEPQFLPGACQPNYGA